MWKWITISTIIIAGLTLQACAPKKAQDDGGYVQNVYGERVSWKGQVPITLYIHSSFPDEYIGAVEAAARTWEQAAGYKLFNVVTQKIGGVPQQDRISVIYFMKDWEADKMSQQGRTSVYWLGDQIKEADMRINANFAFYWNQPKGSQAVNMEALVLHEMGHILGLKHRDQSVSVMATYLASNTDRVRLSEEDIKSLKYEY